MVRSSGYIFHAFSSTVGMNCILGDEYVGIQLFDASLSNTHLEWASGKRYRYAYYFSSLRALIQQP